MFITFPGCLLRLSLGLAVVFAVGPAHALSLSGAVQQALAHDPRVAAATAQADAGSAGLEHAHADYRPRLNLDAAVGVADLNSDIALLPDNCYHPVTVAATLSQSLYEGGRLDAGLARAKALHESATADAEATRQTVILDTVVAYFDVLRDTSVIHLDEADVKGLEINLNQAHSRLDAGEITRTDVSLAESRLAQARADLRLAQMRLASSQHALQRLIGDGSEAPASDWQAPAVPASLEQARASVSTLPEVRALDAYHNSAQAQVDASRAGYLPTVSMDLSAFRADGLLGSHSTVDGWAVLLRLKMPLYEGGRTGADVRRSQALAERARSDSDDARQRADEKIRNAWEEMQASLEVSRALEVRLEAARLAETGVRKEMEAGERNTLDLLNAERERLEAEVDLVRSKHDVVVSSYRLLAAQGTLTLENMGTF